MSDEQETEQIEKAKPQVSPLSLFKFRQHDEKAALIRDLLISDKNNPVKARIPTIFGMVMLQELGIWDAPNGTEYKIGDVKKNLGGTVASDQEYFYDMYNQISQAYQGLARGEYERAASAYLGQMQALQGGAAQARAEEGAKKKT